ENSPIEKKKLIVTDTVFSMDGDTAGLSDIVELARRYNCLVMVDEAHATGAFGPKGNGMAADLGLTSAIDIHMGTLSKAIGTHGAYVCGSKELIDFLVNFSRPFIYTTALPAAIAAASLQAIDIIESEPELRVRLWDNVSFLKDGLKGLGFDTLESNSPIIPVVVNDAQLTMKMSAMLFEHGVFIQGIRPPTVAKGQSRLRITVTAAHTQDDLAFALEKIKTIGKKLCLI
ncbi:aminotransferase class I/II-fold pyridoxal phosphate-dependent enzyme, partial [Candidatus Omnitrophota bacterium]